jgi:D-alanine-D-alanine ligase
MTYDDHLNGYRVGVIAGGSSSERDISLKSGKAVFNALVERGVNVVFLDVDAENILPAIERNNVDLAFIALHGKFGEDGTIQELLDEAGVPYTGSGPVSSRTAIDKVASKKKFSEVGILVPAHVSVFSGSDILSAAAEIGFPCVVKPRYEGSSIGLSVVREPVGLVEALGKAVEFGSEVIIEKFVPGREITVGMLEDKALPVLEIITSCGVYDYGSKYISSETRYRVPADISPESSLRAQEIGLAAHRALGCRGFSRTDMRMTAKGEFYVLETNTIPGLTEKSLLPMAAAADGVDFGELCVKMLKSALID